MANRTLVPLVKKLIPKLSEKAHKGQAGRVGVVGGSADYTGAPFFSSMSSMYTGSDLAHVICSVGAGDVIKGYSPDLIVHKILDENLSKSDLQKELSGIIDRLHSVVIGPGLGRDDFMQSCGKEVLKICRDTGKWVVIDADGLFMVTQDPSIVSGYERALLTPNVVEFRRLCEKMEIDPKSAPPEELCSLLSKSLGGLTILQKGPQDLVSNGSDLSFLPTKEHTLTIDRKGGLKRSGGQGDVLSGACGTFLAWFSAYSKSSSSAKSSKDVDDKEKKYSDQELCTLAGYAASTMTRDASRLAFEKKGRGMVSQDVLHVVGDAFADVWGEDLAGGDEPSRL